MGGFGSGRSGGGRCTNDMLALDVRKINRAGLLTPGRWFSWQWTCNGEVTATISLRVETDRGVLDYRNRSSHHNGGEWESMNYAVRLDWTSCGFGGRRVWWQCPVVGCGRRVAVLHGGRVFACRQSKPKGMHWRTFERLQASHDENVNRALAGMASKLALLGERINGFG